METRIQELRVLAHTKVSGTVFRYESQEIQWLPDGDLILSLKVADTAEVKRWILGFGQDAEVLEPASLREEIRAEAEALLRHLEVSDALREISAEQLTLPVMGAV